MTNNRNDPLSGWRSPPAPPHLKRQAMAAALDSSREPIKRRIEDRLWESSAIRYGWLAAASLLLVLNLAVGVLDPATVHATNVGTEVHPATEVDVGMPIPEPARGRWTLAEAQQVVRQILTDPCLDPLTQGDCT